MNKPTIHSKPRSVAYVPTTGRKLFRNDGLPRKLPVEMIRGKRVPAGTQMVLNGLVSGKSQVQIANEHNMEVKTVAMILYRGRKTLRCRNNEQLVYEAMKAGFIQ